MTTTMDWTDEVITRLRQLWAEGHSTAEIGRRLGVSKNSIVGKAHRLELDPRPSPIRNGGPGARRKSRPTPPPLRNILQLPSRPPSPSPRTKAATKKPSKPQPRHPRRPLTAAIKPPPLAAKAPIPPRIGEHACCWPIGEPGTKGFQFCDAPALAGKPYCEQHAARAYQPKPVRPGRSGAAA